MHQITHLHTLYTVASCRSYGVGVFWRLLLYSRETTGEMTFLHMLLQRQCYRPEGRAVPAYLPGGVRAGSFPRTPDRACTPACRVSWGQELVDYRTATPTPVTSLKTFFIGKGYELEGHSRSLPQLQPQPQPLPLVPLPLPQPE